MNQQKQNIEFTWTHEKLLLVLIGYILGFWTMFIWYVFWLR